MSSIVRLFIALGALEVFTSGESLAADQTEFELFYSSRIIGEPATLQIGPNKRHLMRTFELTTIDGIRRPRSNVSRRNNVRNICDGRRSLSRAM